MTHLEYIKNLIPYADLWMQEQIAAELEVRDEKITALRLAVRELRERVAELSAEGAANDES
jgi:hypothetical protein